MIRVIVREKVNGRCYTFAILDVVENAYGLNKCVKRGLLKRQKKIEKIWDKCTKLTANIYIDRNCVGNIDFEL